MFDIRKSELEFLFGWSSSSSSFDVSQVSTIETSAAGELSVNLRDMPSADVLHGGSNGAIVSRP